jgi:hypothetical protein
MMELVKLQVPMAADKSKGLNYIKKNVSSGNSPRNPKYLKDENKL